VISFKDWLKNEENRGGARKIKNMGKLSVQSVNPAGPLRPDNLIARPNTPKGTLPSALNPFKKPKSAIINPNK
jgi:hypothetical protein